MGKYIPEFAGLMIPAEYEPDFSSNPEKALRDYGAIPSRAIEPYIRDKRAISDCIDYSLDFFIKSGIISDNYQCSNSFPRIIHIDLALNKDRAGISMGYRDGEEVKIDFATTITAPKGGEIKFSSVRDIIYILKARGVPIVLVSYDGWQSIDSRQILEGQGYKVKILSVDRTLEPYETFKSQIYNRKIKYPNEEILVKELSNLELIKGKKVDHPPRGSKDVSDAVAGVCFWLMKRAYGEPRIRTLGG